MYVRIVRQSEKRVYDLTAVDGIFISQDNTFFFDERADPHTRMVRFMQIQGELVVEKEWIDKLLDHKGALWTQERREWEVFLVYHAWENNLAHFSPYLTNQNQLGDKMITTFSEWDRAVRDQRKPFRRQEYHHSLRVGQNTALATGALLRRVLDSHGLR